VREAPRRRRHCSRHPVFISEEAFPGFVQSHLEAGVCAHELNELVRIKARLLQDVRVGRSLPKQSFKVFPGWIRPIGLIDISTGEQLIWDRAKVTIGE